MENEETPRVKLETKLIGDIEGDFWIPSYQRGYRWTDLEVQRLLDDISSAQEGQDYCLQPVVVRKRENGSFELIDGQQRLTTIYLIYCYMNNESRGFFKEPAFTLSYETREASADFLESIGQDQAVTEEQAKKNIDFSYMWKAYQAIDKWFGGKGGKSQSALTNINKSFDENVKIIWYEVDESEDPIELFTRLNIGKIPLTNAELVKARLLCSDGNDATTDEKRQEIAFQWDLIEKELHDDSLWYFLMNRDRPTRIDAILDLVAGERGAILGTDSYATFFAFERMREQREKPSDIWGDVCQAFLVLKGWYDDHELYHKIGYLITCGEKTLKDVYDDSQKVSKSEFRKKLDESIKESIRIGDGRNYAELSYEYPSDQDRIERLLLLFNVESVRTSADESQRFPFDKHKGSEWSLEHIHAQHSESLRTKKEWQEWLKLQKKSIEDVYQAKLDGAENSPKPGQIEEWKEFVKGSASEHVVRGVNPSRLVRWMQEASSNNSLSGEEFRTIQEFVENLLSEKGDVGYLHSIANMALLGRNDNSALNNSTFDVKRNKIIGRDRSGEYIPYCTRNVFLKYYTPSGETQLHFWGLQDRKHYVEAMNKKMGQYLDEEIIFENSEENPDSEEMEQ